jgi:hypothetical protein
MPSRRAITKKKKLDRARMANRATKGNMKPGLKIRKRGLDSRQKAKGD